MRETKFQNTEIGLIPEDWRIVPLGQLFDFKNGLNKGKEFFGFGTPIINFTDVFNNPQMYQSTIKGLVSVSSNDIKSCNAHKGDVFFTRTSETPEEVGMSSVLLDELDSAVFSGFVLRARPKTDLLNSEYSGLCLRSNTIRQQIIKSATYTTRALTSGAKLSDVLLPLPTLDEQRKIAKALSDIDGLIDSLSKLIDKKKNIKTGAMQQLLTGEKRLAGFSEAWEYKKLSDTGFMTAGGTPSTMIPEYWDGNINWLQSGVVHDCVVEESQVDKHITLEGLQHSSAHIIKKDSVLIAITGATCANVAYLPFESTANQSVVSIETNTENHPYFLYNLLKMYRGKILELRSGSAQGGVSLTSLKELNVYLPASLKEQSAIASILTDMDTEIASLEAKKEKFELIKKGMMQELLTGKVRLV